MNEIELVVPESDRYMRYDFLDHCYVLTKAYAYEVLGIPEEILTSEGDTDNTTMWERFLSEVSDTVYQQIYRYAWSTSFLECLLACYAPLRPVVQKMLSSQLPYAMQNGFLGGFSGVNLKKGTAMPLKDLRGAVTVSATVERMIAQDIPGLGFPLNTLNRLPEVPKSMYRVGY